MDQVAFLEAEHLDAHQNAAVDRFLAGLSQLSRDCGIGITGDPILFIMEGEDFQHGYRSDGDSRLLR